MSATERGKPGIQVRKRRPRGKEKRRDRAEKKKGNQ